MKWPWPTRKRRPPLRGIAYRNVKCDRPPIAAPIEQVRDFAAIVGILAYANDGADFRDEAYRLMVAYKHKWGQG